MKNLLQEMYLKTTKSFSKTNKQIKKVTFLAPKKYDVEIIDECTELNNTSTKKLENEAIKVYENLMKQGFEKHKLNRHFPNGCLI